MTATATTRPTREQQAQMRRTQLLDVALGLFAEVGFERATIKSLAGKAGVSQGLLYHYFTSKEDLIVEVMQRYSILPRLPELYRRVQELPVAEGLPRIAREIYRLLWDNKEVVWLFFREIRTNPHIAARCEMARHESARMLAGYLEHKVGCGELRAHDSDVAARGLLSVIFQMHLRGLPREDFLEEFTELLLGGLKA